MPDEQFPGPDLRRRLPPGVDSGSPRDGQPERKFADVLVWSMIGCGALVFLTCGVAGIGGVAWFLAAKVQDGAPVGELDQTESAEGTNDGVAPGQLPEPPLPLAVPSPPASKFGETDLTTLEPSALSGAAYHLYGRRQYQAAVQFQYQFVIKSQSGQYNLACFYARAGDVPAALYWLQVAALEDGVDVDHAGRDHDLVEVRKDGRWPKLRGYLRACGRYWEASGYSETSLILPQDVAPGTALPVFIGLHGLGSDAHEFINGEKYQILANKIGAAFLGVSGTHCRGKHSFVWSEDHIKDRKRVDAALQEVAEKLTPAEGQIVLFGFSQGGMVSAELAGRDPKRFAGAILLSPGSVSNVVRARLALQPENRRQGLVAVCGAGEHPTTVNCTKRYASLYESQQRRVYLKIYPNMNQHTFPPDFAEKFPIWGKFVLDPSAAAPE